MACHLIQSDLVPYHFGVIDDEGRTRVEEHLVSCPQCLRDYIALKREMETTAEKPSPAAKARLRSAVADEVTRSRVTWSWWERPLAVAFASAAILVAGFAVHSLATSEGVAPRAAIARVTLRP
jgi:anti-sigma factor RsiW